MAPVACPHCRELVDDGDPRFAGATTCPQCGKLIELAGEQGISTLADISTPPGVPDTPSVQQAKPATADRVVILALLGSIGFLVALIGVVLLARQFRLTITGRDTTAGQEMSDAEQPAGQRTVAAWIEQLVRGPGQSRRDEAAGKIVASGAAAVTTTLDAIVKIGPAGEAISANKPAMSALARVGAELAPTLAKGLSDERANVRVAASGVLRQMGPQAAAVLEPLAAAACDENRWVRWYAVEAIGNIGPGAAGVVGSLLPLIGHEDRYTRRRAIAAIGEIGPAAKSALPALTKAEKRDADRSVRQAAGVAIYQVNLEAIAAEAASGANEEARPLIVALRSEDDIESVSAAESLGRMGPSAVASVPALALALRSDNKWLRQAAADALGAIGQRASKTAPMLHRATGDPEPKVRAAARRALELIEGGLRQ